MAHSNCIFCKILTREAPATILFENDEIIVFADIKPAAKHHFLVVPKNHIPSINSLVSQEDKLLIERMVQIGKKVLEDNGGDVNDVRLGFHCPPFNSISHLHLHVISPASEMGFFSRLVFKPNTYWFQCVDDTLTRLNNKL
ncbi:unnamed protein product [Psylliodes chrysocephalus]|uniref:Adenosine 5'-monophosphoramidase HINT3 n=1 Tax=Psylliodes chrysocephalus TaxID=3402493 RepID=A0A9P0CDH1_9CUCU|nr:unnamed protein product [Psylliodes chrysocephala]